MLFHAPATADGLPPAFCIKSVPCRAASRIIMLAKDEAGLVGRLANVGEPEAIGSTRLAFGGSEERDEFGRRSESLPLLTLWRLFAFLSMSLPSFSASAGCDSVFSSWITSAALSATAVEVSMLVGLEASSGCWAFSTINRRARSKVEIHSWRSSSVSACNRNEVLKDKFYILCVLLVN